MMPKVTVLFFLLHAFVIARADFGFPCLDPFSGTMRSHLEKWARPDLPCSGIVCNNGDAKPSVCQVPDLVGNPQCELDTSNSHMAYPLCCPTLKCPPVY